MLARWLVGGFFCALIGSTLQGAENPRFLAKKSLDIRVEAKAFGKTSSEDITQVLQSAGSELWRHCPRIQLGGIDVYHRNDHPQTHLKKSANGRIAIGLTARNTSWAQYSFQFAHEFCHVMANYGNNQRSVAYPRQPNLWLEESLCETASLFTLRAMSRSWQNAPPYSAWKTYAPWFSSYIKDRLALPQHHLPVGTPFLVWFQKNQAALRRNSTMRDRNTIIAIQLLPLFEADPHGWETLTFLNRDYVNPNQSLAEHLAVWKMNSPAERRPFIGRLAAVFGVSL